jgi:site-specific DNA recombinase
VPRELFEKVEQRARRNQIAVKQSPADYPTRRGRRAGRVYVLRGRVRCSLCGRRMEGTHQKDANYYRCRFTASRGPGAAEATGHPRSLQIKEDALLQALFSFMDRRLFGPKRQKLLRNELAHVNSIETASKTRSARKQSRTGPIAGEAPGLRPAVKPQIEEVVELRG